MEQNWWSSDWIKYLIGLVIGIPSGIVANWLYDKIRIWRRKETNFLNTSYSKGIMKFEGQVTTKATIQTLIKQVLEPPSERLPNQVIDEYSISKKQEQSQE